MKPDNFKETRHRSLIKAAAWRGIAVLNSFMVLVLNFSDKPLQNALIMNLTGFALYFFYERLCNKISWGKINESR